MDTLPDELSIERWIKARNAEIASLAQECKVKLPQQMSQRLPRYMRRRAASGNPKRIPKSVRPWWLEDKTTVKKKKKQQRTKYKSAALAIRSRKRRNDDPSRSPIHVWLAKRFKMQLMWGQRIAWSNCTKNQRSLFRKARSSYCIYYLSNFMKCIKVKSSSENISYTSPIKFNLEGEEFLFVHCSERQNVNNSNESDEDVSNLFQLVRLVGVKSSEIAATLPQEKCTLLTGKFDKDRPYVDVICSLDNFKQIIWPKLSKNKGHLVGGLRDWCMLHLNSNNICFPFFGYPHSIHSPSYTVLNEKYLQFNQSSEVNSLLPVVITATGRGTPCQWDEICSLDDNSVIGLIEFGAYCMQSGRGKGVGVIFYPDQVNITFPLSIQLKSVKTGNLYKGEVSLLNED